MSYRVTKGLLALTMALTLSCRNKTHVTYAKDIAPVIYANCTSCHRPGSAGPFSLLSYNDAAKRSKMLALVTSSRQMPPWPADNTYSHFTDEKVLTPAQIELF